MGFLVGDLRRKMGSYALQWRKSRPFFLTCAQKSIHLRQKTIDTCTNMGTCANMPLHFPQLRQTALPLLTGNTLPALEHATRTPGTPHFPVN